MNIAQGLSAEGVQLYVAELQSSFLAPAGEAAVEAAGAAAGTDSAERADKSRAWAVQQLCAAAQLPAASAAVKQQTLQFLALHGLIAVQGKPKGKVQMRSPSICEGVR